VSTTDDWLNSIPWPWNSTRQVSLFAGFLKFRIKDALWPIYATSLSHEALPEALKLVSRQDAFDVYVLLLKQIGRHVEAVALAGEGDLLPFCFQGYGSGISGSIAAQPKMNHKRVFLRGFGVLCLRIRREGKREGECEQDKAGI